MYLKAVGGALDGRLMPIKYSERNMNRFTWPIHRPPSLKEYAEGKRWDALKPGSDHSLTTYHSYTRRKIMTPDGEIEFLAPEDWTDFQALSWAFERSGK
jgi:hypothetical protein